MRILKVFAQQVTKSLLSPEECFIYSRIIPTALISRIARTHNVPNNAAYTEAWQIAVLRDNKEWVSWLSKNPSRFTTEELEYWNDNKGLRITRQMTSHMKTIAWIISNRLCSDILQADWLESDKYSAINGLTAKHDVRNWFEGACGYYNFKDVIDWSLFV